MYQNLRAFDLPKSFRGRSPIIVQLWWLVQSLLYNPSPQFLYSWRRFLLRLFGAKIGRDVLLRPSSKVTFPWKLSIGDYSWIGDEVILYNLAPIHIGEHVVVSQRSYICTGSHNYDILDFPIFAKSIKIEGESWLATDVFIAPGITIGSGTVIGARSSVFRDLPAGKICLGNPAKVIKDREMRQAASLGDTTVQSQTPIV